MTLTPSVLVLMLAGAVFFGGAVGLVLGLYLGERGRRQAAERAQAFGSPLAGGAPGRRLPTPPDPEHRAMMAGYSEETMKRAVRDLKAEAERRGRPINDAEAREMAETLLYSGAPDGFEGAPTL